MQPLLMARLTAPIAGVSLILLGIALGAAWYTRNAQRSTASLLANDVASVRAALELEISIREVQMRFDRYLITGDRTHLDGVPRLRERAVQALESAERLAFTESEQVLMRQVRQGYDHFFDEYDRLVRNPPPQGVHAKVLELNDKVLREEVLDPTRQYLRLNEGMLAKSSEANQHMAERLTAALIGLGVCGAVGGMLAGWVIASTVRRSLLQTEETLRTTAAKLNRAAKGAAAEPAPTAGDTTLDQVKQSASAVLKRLRQTERDALRAEQLAWVGQMAAGIAHEVRNPMMAIKLLVQAASDARRPTALGPKDLEVLEEEILRVEEIVSMFLDFARPARPDKKPVEARELLRGALERVRARAELQTVALRLDAPADPLPLSADPNQLRQVMYNLLFNALDMLPAGGEVTVTAERDTTDAGPWVVVRVEDTGPGLPPAMTERVFDPFVSTKETGLGLGLSICRRIVEAHGGTIGGENRPGGGARFTVRLPAGVAAERPPHWADETRRDMAPLGQPTA